MLTHVSLGQRRHRSHRQRHCATGQLPPPTAPANVVPRTEPHLEYPAEYLDEHTESGDAGSYEEQVDRVGGSGPVGGVQETGVFDFDWESGDE